jgi:hypothetical protein
LSNHHYSELICACRELFGPDIDPSAAFLNCLKPGGVKAAYRRRAKETHPDLIFGTDCLHEARHAERFIRINHAYNILNDYIGIRAKNAPASAIFKGPASDPLSEPVRRKKTRDFQEHYYRGELPHGQLPFGRYLYYRGIIPYRTLLDALAWQRKTNRPIGMIARERRWLSYHDISEILSLNFGRFGEKAVRLDLLKPLQVNILLLHQLSSYRKIGQYFTHHNLISRQRMEKLIREFWKHNFLIKTRVSAGQF